MIVAGTMTVITLNNLNADPNCWKECVQYDEDDCSVLLILITQLMTVSLGTMGFVQRDPSWPHVNELSHGYQNLLAYISHPVLYLRENFTIPCFAALLLVWLQYVPQLLYFSSILTSGRSSSMVAASKGSLLEEARRT